MNARIRFRSRNINDTICNEVLVHASNVSFESSKANLKMIKNGIISCISVHETDIDIESRIEISFCLAHNFLGSVKRRKPQNSDCHRQNLSSCQWNE